MHTRSVISHKISALLLLYNRKPKQTKVSSSSNSFQTGHPIREEKNASCGQILY